MVENRGGGDDDASEIGEVGSGATFGSCGSLVGCPGYQVPNLVLDVVDFTILRLWSKFNSPYALDCDRSLPPSYFSNGPPSGLCDDSKGGGSILSLSLAVFLRRLRKRQIAKTSSKRKTIPPAAPPTIGARFDLELDVAVVTAAAGKIVWTTITVAVDGEPSRRVVTYVEACVTTVGTKVIVCTTLTVAVDGEPSGRVVVYVDCWVTTEVVAGGGATGTVWMTTVVAVVGEPLGRILVTTVCWVVVVGGFVTITVESVVGTIMTVGVDVPGSGDGDVDFGGVGVGVGVGVWIGVGVGVEGGFGVGVGVGVGIGVGIGVDIGVGVGIGVEGGFGVVAGVDGGIGVGVWIGAGGFVLAMTAVDLITPVELPDIVILSLSTSLFPIVNRLKPSLAESNRPLQGEIKLQKAL